MNGKLDCSTELIIQAAGSSEGGQLIIADGGQYSLAGESPNSWNIDSIFLAVSLYCVFVDRLLAHYCKYIQNVPAVDHGDVFPATDSSQKLGSASYRWSEIYANKLYASEIYIGGQLIQAAGGITFSTPTVVLDNGDSLQLARFTLPSGKSLKVYRAQVAKNDGSSATGLTIEVYDATNSTVVYSTNSNTVQEGNPLASSNPGIQIIIRIKNNTGNAVSAQGFVVVSW